LQYYFADPTLPDHTIYQPKTVPAGLKLPVLLWGNGACADDGTGFQAFLGEVASYGFFVIADGPINGSQSKTTTSAVLKASLEWVTTNGGKGNYTSVDPTKIAVSGQSCGGLEAYDLRADSRIFTIGIFNSGEFSAADSKTVAGSITKPIFYFLGGSADIAYTNVSSRRQLERIVLAIAFFG
jgi:dienelactone hydrolase